MDIKNNYISIPNVVANSKIISVNAKYLYGWIYNEIFYGNFEKTMEDIKQILNCSESTARKVLKELKTNHFIEIEIISGNRRKITPMINDSMIINERTRINNERLRKEIIEFQEKNQVRETPQFVKDFVTELK